MEIIIPNRKQKWKLNFDFSRNRRNLCGVDPAPSTINGNNTLDMANFLAYILAMKTANIGELKDNLSKFISMVEQGEEIEICKRNIPIALLVPHGPKKTGNRTQLGCGLGTVQVKGDLTEPLIPENSWDMLK